MDEFDEAVEIFCGHLLNISSASIERFGIAYSFILLIKVVHVAIEYLNEEFH